MEVHHYPDSSPPAVHQQRSYSLGVPSPVQQNDYSPGAPSPAQVSPLQAEFHRTHSLTTAQAVPDMSMEVSLSPSPQAAECRTPPVQEPFSVQAQPKDLESQVTCLCLLQLLIHCIFIEACR